MQHLTYDKDHFYLEGKPLRILSGALHYFRVPRAYWRDRLQKLRALGLNTVETYVAWNVHEPREGEYRFDGEQDLGAFLDEAAQLGLYALVRPGPYICAEWEFGGLPAWLLRDADMRLRTCDPRFLRHTDRYFDALAPILTPRLHENGGNIIGVQLENEYGSYGADKRYLRRLLDAMRARGICGAVFTSDGPGHTMLSGGTLPGVLKTVNFGSGAAERFPLLLEHQPDAPPMCCEFWDGWFDHWKTETHNTRPAQETARELESILAQGGSFNLYMFCGGTNFGFMNGANLTEGRFHPTVTSYDYDAPLSEGGDYTPKYHAFRAVIQKYAPAQETELPPAPRTRSYGRVELREQAPLFPALSSLSAPIESPYLLSMEQAGQNTGFILYRATVRGPADADSSIVIKSIRDRAIVFINGDFRGVFSRDDGEEARIPISLGFGETASLDILVENMGRVNYGDRLSDNRKGILGGVFLQYQHIPDWEIFPLPLEDLGGLRYQDAARGAAEAENEPAFWRGTFTADAAADTYLDTAGMGKGVAFINGVNIGRYWSAGPQQTLYIPAPFIREGENRLELFELHHSGKSVELLDHPILG